MIPKIIHYCWFGGKELPKESVEYIKSWKKYCPEYEIKEWNETNFNLESCVYVSEAYEAGKWAFITDYVRLKVLYEFGGIYMDTDVEVLKPLDCFLSEKAFSGFERVDAVPTGIMASEKLHPFFKTLLGFYDNTHFRNADGTLNLTTNVETITNSCVKEGLILNGKKQTVADFTMYPMEYFCPKDSRTLKVTLTENTYTIHHFAGTWLPKNTCLKKRIKVILGTKRCERVISLMNRFHIK